MNSSIFHGNCPGTFPDLMYSSGQKVKKNHVLLLCKYTQGLSHGSVDDLLDVENKRLAENLAAKVSRLKSLAYDVDREAEDQNEYLDNMDSNFLSVTGLLSGSVKRFSTMVRSSRDNRRILCYVSGGLVLGFFLLYYLVSRIQR
ncbi:BET1-like protein isoform X3 [Scophthalmus maximus]|uniref:BET1-like protein n=1 Tax=Scophthalmus maximus TaxID=52904 RepID=A0A8D3CT46_SCOMX|nr:BET1-like protein isoform X3 [Scophthalmus maximus]